MKRRTHLAVVGAMTAISLCVFAVPTPAQTSSSTASSQAGTFNTSQDKTLAHVDRANKLIGKEIKSSDNQRIGKLDNLVVDLETGRILYALIGSGGVGKVGETRYAVAPGLFTEADNSLMINVDKQKLTGAPQFTSEMEKNGQLNQADFVYKVYQYFGQNAWWQGKTAPNEGTFHNTHLANDVIGMKIQNVNNETMGKVDNLAVDLPAGRVVYVILNPDSSLNLGNNYYALPPDAFTLASDQKSLSSDINKDKLAAAPHFDKNNWAQLSDTQFASQVYQYYGKQAWFQTGGTFKPTGRTGERSYPEKK